MTGLYISVRSFKSAYAEAGGINPRQIEVSLRKRPDLSSQTVTTLGAGEFASLTKPLNQWNYFYSVHQGLTVQKQDFKLGYSRVFGILVFKTKSLKFLEKQIDAFVPYVIISLSILLFIFSLARSRKRHQNSDSSHSYNAIEPLEAVYYIKPRSSGDSELNHQVARKYLDSLSIDQEQEESQAIEVCISREDEKKELEAFFYRKAEKEINAKYQNDIAAMARTIYSLKEKYKDAEKKASILGVDLNDSNSDNLVKGRLFELFAAFIWDKDPRTTIEDWTSDKGFNEKIYVKSNGNPDFVVSHTETYKVVAVECKFRSRFSKDKKSNEAVFTHVGEEKKINRYRAYQTEKEIAVFILLGVGGSAEQPNNLYLLTLDDINSIRTKDNDKFDNVRTVRKRLEPYKISEYELIDYLF